MIKIAFANTKGGVGKTTLSAAVSVEAAREFRRVAAVDLDPQGSLAQWFRRRGSSDNPVCLQGVDTAEEAIERLEHTGWDYCFFDTPPAFLTTIKSVIAVADLVLIPVRPSVLDMLAMQDAVVLAREANAAFMCCLSDVGAGDKKVAQAARTFLLNANVPIAQTQVNHRVSHVAGMTVGKVAAEVNGGRDRLAAAEISALWREIKPLAIKAAQEKSRKATNV